MTTLELYKEMNEKYASVFTIATKCLMYKSVEAFIDEPTDEEYETIANVCCNAFMKDENCNLVKLADRVSEAYSNGEFTLEELKEMSRWTIIKEYGY